MQVFPSLQTFESARCSPLYGIARFELFDESGSLPVETLGSCHPAAMDLPHDGEVVELTAEIHVFAPVDRTERVLEAIAQAITCSAIPQEPCAACCLPPFLVILNTMTECVE